MIKKLSVSKPIIDSLPWDSCYLSILSAYKECQSWIYTKFIQLMLKDIDLMTQTKDFRVLFNSLYCDDSDLCPWFRETSHKIRRDIIEIMISYKEFENMIYEYINKNYYVSIELDDYYIKNTNAYQKFHIFHEHLLYGYNLKTNKISINGFFRGNKFDFKEIDVKQIKRAFYSDYCIDSFTPQIRLLKIDINYTYEFDLNNVKKIISDYIFSDNTQQYFGVYENNKYVYGLKIYDYLIEIFKTGMINYNQFIRSCYVLYNHKIYMMEVFKYIKLNYGLEYDGNKLLSVKNEMQKILYRSIKYQMQYSNKRLIIENISSVKLVRKMEYQVYGKFLLQYT